MSYIMGWSSTRETSQLTGEGSEEEADATRSIGRRCSSWGGKGEEVEVGVWGDAGHPPLERLEQRQLHVPDGGRPERMTRHLLHLPSITHIIHHT